MSDSPAEPAEPLPPAEPGAPADPHLREARLDSQLLFKGKFLTAYLDTVRLPDGGTATREYVTHPGAVVVVPLLDDDHVLMERQYRYPVGLTMIEFPAGKLDPHEGPLRCGQRELAEETGYRAAEWAYAGRMHLAIAYSTEVIHIYFARGLSRGERQLDEGEFIDVFALPIDELDAMVARGDITDAKTLTCLVWLHNLRAGRWAPTWRAQDDATPPAATPAL